MEKKEVKIIGLQINTKFGILESCNLKFDQNNNLIVVKGNVGSGKSTLHKSLMLGTHGSDSLKNDKSLYGKVDQETQLLDGKTNVFIGCKSNPKGEIVYVIYTKDEQGNIDKTPIIDGVKATPSSYLKSLQTELTWRMDELTSDNPTIQKNILLQLYKSDLNKIGVLFDKKNEGYEKSILGRIALAENKRDEADHSRKKVGGFANMLEPLGIFINQPDTMPVRVDVKELEDAKNKLVFSKSTLSEQRDQNLKDLKTKADAVVVEMKALNLELLTENGKVQSEYDDAFEKFEKYSNLDSEIIVNLCLLKDLGCFPESCYKEVCDILKNNVDNPAPSIGHQHYLIQFDDGKCTSKSTNWDSEQLGYDLLKKLESFKSQYMEVSKKDVGEDPNKEEFIQEKIKEIELANTTNEQADMVDAYIDWHDSNTEVLKLKKEYSEMLASINTGVDGLKIFVDKEDEKLSIYLTYDGSYDPSYFNNPNKDQRKLSSYSGTQKPMICLLLQNYLLNKKPKAMRYLWIDNVPIDKKTKQLLDDMGKNLDMTIIVNITGDFDFDGLSDGEILLDGGEIFFK